MATAKHRCVASRNLVMTSKRTRLNLDATSTTTGHSIDDEESIIQIDGSQGEGGGQIVRNGISFASILGKKVCLSNIRRNRGKPGLAAQHVTALQLASSVSGGRLLGAEMGSMACTYEPSVNGGRNPGRLVGGTETLIGDTRTAGSICLLLQAALPCALFRRQPIRLVLRGGTNASLAPQYDYWARVFWPTLRNRCRLRGDQVQARVVRRGYYPRGGGEVQVCVMPLETALPSLRICERGEVSSVYIRSFHAGKLPRVLAVDMAKAAQRTIMQQLNDDSAVPLQINTEIVTETHAVGSGLGILVVAQTTTGCLLAGSSISTPKDRARCVGREAANELVSTLKDGGCVDDWLQDQLILFMALADGVSEIQTGSLTQHTQTAIWVAETMSGAKFEVTKLDECYEDSTSTGYSQVGRIPGRHRIRCQGIGFLHSK